MGLLPKFDAQEVLSLHCPLCSFHSHWTEKLEMHFLKTHLGRSAEFNLFQCSMCKKIASSKAFVLEHLELQHRSYKEETPTSPSSDSDALMRLEDSEAVQRPGSTPGTRRNTLCGSVVPIFSGCLRGGEIQDGAFHYQCLFCEFSTSIREVLATHYVHHGIKNLQCSEKPTMATTSTTMTTLEKDSPTEDSVLRGCLRAIWGWRAGGRTGACARAQASDVGFEPAAATASAAAATTIAIIVAERAFQISPLFCVDGVPPLSHLDDKIVKLTNGVLDPTKLAESFVCIEIQLARGSRLANDSPGNLLIPSTHNAILDWPRIKTSDVIFRKD
ncbi:unnamed protein product [Mesocestoides corti]|uniref:C2H2-type domain-containing protein n=1 Tax=Mesocestoides corti TaxID=53468 RepID=A0A158QUU6_MESCO|nr:unnamed protein product [Mesocestoides corti]